MSTLNTLYERFWNFIGAEFETNLEMHIEITRFVAQIYYNNICNFFHFLKFVTL